MPPGQRCAVDTPEPRVGRRPGLAARRDRPRHDPTSAGDLVVALSGHLVACMANAITTIDDDFDDLQDVTLRAHNVQVGDAPCSNRREIIELRAAGSRNATPSRVSPRWLPTGWGRGG